MDACRHIMPGDPADGQRKQQFRLPEVKPASRRFTAQKDATALWQSPAELLQGICLEVMEKQVRNHHFGFGQRVGQNVPLKPLRAFRPIRRTMREVDTSQGRRLDRAQLHQALAQSSIARANFQDPPPGLAQTLCPLLEPAVILHDGIDPPQIAPTANRLRMICRKRIQDFGLNAALHVSRCRESEPATQAALVSASQIWIAATQSTARRNR